MDQDVSAYWLEGAESSISASIDNHKTGHYDFAGFLYHLTIEKALKAAVAAAGRMPPRTHSLMRLAEISGILDDMSEEQTSLLDELFPLNIEGRYPEVDGHKLDRAASWQIYIKRRHYSNGSRNGSYKGIKFRVFVYARSTEDNAA